MRQRPLDARAFASSFVPLQVGDRGGHPDFVRLGAWAACTADGRLLASAGNPDLPAFLRLSAKPFQAIAFLRRGLDARLGLTTAEIACACASHEAEDVHVAAARRILDAAGVPASALLCGTHAPGNAELERRIARGETELSPLHNNCSGKHAAMLATCRHERWDESTYPDATHPLQRENLETLAAFAGMPVADVTVAVDNCTVPTFALPLRASATAFARLMKPEDGVPAELGEAASRAVRAMTSNPEMVGGTGRLDTLLMQATSGRVVAKTGANGFYAAAGPRATGGEVIGVALKLASGEGETQKAAACLDTLVAAGLLGEDEAAPLVERFNRPQLNCRGAVVGHARPVDPRS